jgi:c(7)-type cytochrome triheme protein
MRHLLLVLLLASAGPAAATVGGGDITFPVKGADKAVFSHEAHVVGAKLKCQDCHPGLYLNVAKSKTATMKQMEKGKSCGACHDGKRASALDDCTKCHK